MGDRYTLTAASSELEEHFNKELTQAFSPKYNAAPTQLMPVITQDSEGFSYFYWGQIPGWSNNRSISGKLLYAPAETLRQKPTGRTALESRRCLIPSDGYYVWRQVSRKGRIPYRVVWRQGALFAFAGIWEEFEDESDEPMHTFRIITTAPNAAVADLDERMPLILQEKSYATWLDSATPEKEIDSLLVPPLSEHMHTYTVSPGIENVTNNSPALIKPFSPVDQFGNYSLFD